MANFSDKLADEFVGYGVDLSRYGEGVREEVRGFLLKLERNLEKQIREIDVSLPARSDFRERRLRQLLVSTKSALGRTYGEITKHVTGKMYDLASLEVKTVQDLIKTSAGVDLFASGVSPELLKSISGKVLIEGAPSKEWWGRQSKKLMDRFSDEIRMGMVQGETVNQLVRRVRGRATGKKTAWRTAKGARRFAHEFAGGIMDVTTRDAEALVITSVQAVSQEARYEMYKVNEDVINGVQALATLDTRTTQLCMGRSGKTWDMQGNSLDGGESFPGHPPWHYRCRTTLIPLIKSFGELTKKGALAKTRQKKLDKLPKSTQASMDGQVAGDLTYSDWLKGQTKARQLEVLGPARWEMWSSGDITLANLVNQRGNSLTIKELRAKYLGKGQGDLGIDEVDKVLLDRDLDSAGERMLGAFKESLAGDYSSEEVEAWLVDVNERIFGGRFVELVKQALSADKTAIYMGFRGDGFWEMLKDGGRIRSGSRKGGKTLEMGGRFDSENKLFNITKEDLLDENNVPKYARMDVEDFPGDRGNLYGKIFVKFKNDIRSRTSFTLDDSLEGNFGGYRLNPAYPINDPNIKQLYEIASNISRGGLYTEEFRKQFEEAVKEFVKNPTIENLRKMSDGQYIEVQIFGRLGLDDVVEVHVQNISDAIRIREVLKRLGRDDIKVKGMAYNNSLYDVWKQSAKRISVLDMDNLGDKYISSRAYRFVHTDMPLIKNSYNEVFKRVAREFDEELGVLSKEGKNWGDIEVSKYRRWMRDIQEQLELNKLGVPKEFIEEFKYSQNTMRLKVGFTDDVMDRRLLEDYSLADKLKKSERLVDVDEAIKARDEAIKARAAAEVKRTELEERLKLREKTDQIIDWMSEDSGRDVRAEIKRIDKEIFGGKLEETLRKAMSKENTGVYMVVPENRLRYIFRDGKIKGEVDRFDEINGGTPQADIRVDLERFMFGLDDVNPARNPDAYPKYAFPSGRYAVGEADLMDFGYGDINIKLKNSVRRRTGFTMGDTLDYADGRRIWMPPGAVDSPNILQIATSLLRNGVDNKKYRKLLEEFRDNPNTVTLRKLEGSDYLELQIFGRLNLDDIAEIQVNSLASARFVKRLLKEYGREDIKVVGNPLSYRLDYLWQGRYGSLRGIGTKDLDNLGDAWVKRIWSLEGKTYLSVLKESFDDLDVGMKGFVKRFDGVKKFDVNQKREILRRVQLELERGNDVVRKKLPGDVGGIYSNFTDDVIDKRILKDYKHFDKLRGDKKLLVEIPVDKKGEVILSAAPKLAPEIERVKLPRKKKVNLSEAVDEELSKKDMRRLDAIWSGDDLSVRTVAVRDLDNLGDSYIVKIWNFGGNKYIGELLGVDGLSDELRTVLGKYQGAINLTVENRREIIRAVHFEAEKGSKGVLDLFKRELNVSDDVVLSGFRSKRGFTEVVKNKVVLDDYRTVKNLEDGGKLRVVSGRVEDDLVLKERRLEETRRTLKSQYEQQFELNTGKKIDEALEDFDRDVMGGRLDELLEEAVGKDKAGIYMAVQLDNLEGIVKEGVIKSGSRKGGKTWANIDRFKYEKDWYHLKDSDRDFGDNLPKYVFVDNKEGVTGSRLLDVGYGRIYLKFKDDVRSRTSFTMDDSLGGNARPSILITPPGSINNPVKLQIVNGLSYLEDLKRYKGKDLYDEAMGKAKVFRENPTPKNLRDFLDFFYLEGQIFGKLRFLDVDSVHVESLSDVALVRRILKRYGKEDVRIVGTVHNTELKHLWESRDIFPVLSVRDLDNLGDKYIERIWNDLGKRMIPNVLGKRVDTLSRELKLLYEKYKDVDVVRVSDKREIIRGVFLGVERNWFDNEVVDFYNKRRWREGFTDDVMDRRILKGYDVAYDLERKGKLEVDVDKALAAQKAAKEVKRAEELNKAYPVPVDKILLDKELEVSLKRGKRDYNKEAVEKTGMTIDEGLKYLDDNYFKGELDLVLKRLVSESKVSMYVPMMKESVLEMIKKGRLKGGEEAMRKWKLSDTFFRDDAVYGILGDAGGINVSATGGEGFGNIFLKLKNGVRKRTAFAVDSTTEGVGFNPAYSIDNPIREQFARLFVDNWDASKGELRSDFVRQLRKFSRERDLESFKRMAGNEYMELQTFGRVLLDDLEEIQVQTFSDAKVLRLALNEAGYEELKIVGLVDDSRLKRIWDMDLGESLRLSAGDLDNLGDKYIDRIWRTAGQNQLDEVIEAVENLEELAIKGEKLWKDVVHLLEEVEVGAKMSYDTKKKIMKRIKESKDYDYAASWTGDVLDKRLLVDYEVIKALYKKGEYVVKFKFDKAGNPSVVVG